MEPSTQRPQQGLASYTGDAEAPRMPPRETRLSEIDLSVVTDRLTEHNKNTGLGSTLARLITSTIMQALEESPNAHSPTGKLLANALRQESSQREHARGACEADVTLTLAEIGLTVGPIKSGWQLYGTGKDLNSTTLALHIEDAHRFSGYLGSLDATSITDSQKRGLNELRLSLRHQLAHDYDLSSSDDRLLGLVGAARAMVHHYHRLGLPAEPLEAYLEAIQGRYLKTYIEVEKLQLDIPLEKGDGYRLLWHRDTTSERLTANWNQVLGLLVELSGNPAADHVYKTARSTATKAITKSITEVSQWDPRCGDEYLERKQPFLDILRATRLRMTEF